MEAEADLEKTGEQWSHQRAEVDAHVEDGETGVAPFILLRVQRSDEGGRIGFDTAGAEGNQDQAGGQAHGARKDSQGDVAKNHDRGGVEEHAFGSEDPVRKPRTNDGGQVHATAVCAHQRRRNGNVDAEAAVGDRVVHVVQQDALHAVEGEPFPQLNAEEVRQHAGMAKEGLAGRRGG